MSSSPERSRAHWLLVAGARPNFMKVAPIVLELQRRRAVGEAVPGWSLVHTGQHYDARMSEVFFDELGLPPADVNLGVGSGSHAQQTARVMEAFEPLCDALQPQWVIVVGDVNSTLACTLVAAKKGIRVAHVEAGLRSHDRSMPEELNRLVTDTLADRLLTPSADAGDNLRREGIAAERIECVGNVMIDALVANLARSRARPVLIGLGLAPRAYAYVTLHRPANVDAPGVLGPAIEALAKLARELPVVFAMHPRTRARCAEFGILLADRPGLHVVEPLGYHDSLCLTEHAALVLTDSGGLQEESTWFRVPCLTLRPNTERPVTIELGSNRLTRLETLEADIARALGQRGGLGQVPPLWDGQAAPRIVDSLLRASA
jgi:UDP-N-acetylglucosamine 2-epimerase (non-hydrolysing)